MEYFFFFFRVLNVIRQWADQHFYDFEREPQLSRKLKDFFDRIVKGKAVKKWVQSINKIIERKVRVMKLLAYSFHRFISFYEYELVLILCERK